MPKIRVLSDRVANQIAAGEVIERPAAVVKELVENALDAGATRVEVEFRHGGRSYIRIEDNGCGMSRDDALLALERHATSKIADADDLNRLATFGFRGEALPSIASVSQFSLQTREEGNDAGTEIVINGGRFVHVRDCGRPTGTRMEVAHLFNSVPARRKFLKSDTTEAAHIMHGVRLYALAFPQVAFTLIEDGRIIFRSPACETLEERIIGIFGRQVAEGLVSINADEAGMSLTGLVGRPGGLGRATRHEMVCFVNRRPVDSRTLNYALIESYHEWLPKGRYPVAFVFFEIDPAAVDVNVHPAKREVRFRNEAGVRAFVIRTVLECVREHSRGVAPAVPPPTPEIPRAESASAMQVVVGRGEKLTLPSLSSSVAALGGPAMDTRLGSSAPPASRPAGPPLADLNARPSPGASPVGRPVAQAWRFIGLAHGAYALFETPAGVVLLDRRAAHERIWFERLQAQFQTGQVPSQKLLLPVPVELDPIATALLLDRLQFFQSHGFEIVEFGRNFFRIEAVPGWMEPTDAEPFVRDLLGALRDGRLQDHNMEVAREELARLAAAKAVRLPESQSATELQAMVSQLFACRSPLTSPAGRPTQIELGHAELARRFQK